MAQPRLLLKIGWLPFRSGSVTIPPVRFLTASLLLLAIAGPAPAARIVFAGGQWAAIDFGGRCEARGQALWAKKGTRPFAGFAFGGSDGRLGQFYVHLSRPARPGATVIATIGSEPFLLIGRGDWAWSRSGEQQQAMLNAARYGDMMRVDSRDQGGARIIDRYSLASAATAIDAAAAACAGKMG
jgi:hypothetical protein